jgi:hypothetical protein
VAGAQQGEKTNVEVEPITCWWRSSTSAVRSGEPFRLMLTCSVIEAEAAKVVPDQSKLDPSVVQLAPFEVVGGSHAPDMKVPGKRFFQYEYRMRLINEGTFGVDVDVPELKISYRIESTVSGGDQIQGRDLTYGLKPISLRLLSLVPDDTIDIREAPPAAFQAVEAREFRSNVLRSLGTVLFGLAGVVLLVMVVNSFRRRSKTVQVAHWQVSNRAILGRAAKELADVRQQSRGGWDQDLAGRALSAIRIAGNYAAGRTAGQVAVTDGVVAREGQLLVTGFLGRGRALVSGALLPADLGDSGRALLAARYGRGGELDSSALDDALEAGARVAARVKAEHSLLAEWVRSVTGSLGDIRKKVWAR